MFQTGEVQLIPQPLTGQEQQGRAHQEEMLYSLLGTMSSSPLDTLMGEGIPSSALQSQQARTQRVCSHTLRTLSAVTSHSLFELLQKLQKTALF